MVMWAATWMAGFAPDRKRHDPRTVLARPPYLHSRSPISWKTRMTGPPGTFRILPLVVAALAVAGLSACAGKNPRAAAARHAASKEEIVLLDRNDPMAYRFDMTQDGKQMTADEFDAWMKRHGMRIAKGGPASAKGKAPVKVKKRAND
jgi:hypothetical protein